MRGRTSVKGKHRQPAQFRNKSKTFAERWEVLQFLDKHSIQETIERHYEGSTPRSARRQIERLRHDRERIERMALRQSTASQRRERSQGSATTLSREQEEVVVVWINELRKDGIPVSATMLRLKACQVAEDAGIRGFHARWSWRRGFLKRHQLSIRARTRQGQVTSAEAEGVLLAFCMRVLERIIVHNVAMLYNADQTAVFFEYIPRTTINKRGEKTVWVRCAGKEKDRMTAMLLGDWEGNKAAPFVVLKAQNSRISARQVENEALRNGFGKRSWKAVKKATEGTNLVVYGNPKGWWNEKLSLNFLAYHFGHRTADDRPVMLLWDDMSAHWTQAVLDYAASKAVLLEKVPPRFTFCCQPADVAWNKPFKDRLRARWFQHMRDDMATKQRVTAPKKHDVLQWLNEAWAGLSVSTIVNGFVKCKLLTRHLPADGPVESVVADSALIAALERSRALDQHTTSVDDDVGDGENDSGAIDADANTGDTVAPTARGSTENMGYRDGGGDGVGDCDDGDEEDEIGADPDDESDADECVV